MRHLKVNMPLDDNLTEEVLSHMRRPLRNLPISTEAISPNPDGSLHCVEAIREKVNNRYLLRLRVIIKNYGSARVTVPCNSGEEYRRFLSLRYSIRNSDAVYITLKNLRVNASARGYAMLYLFAQDYTVLSGAMKENSKKKEKNHDC